jgi:hypothetical protein
MTQQQRLGAILYLPLQSEACDICQKRKIDCDLGGKELKSEARSALTDWQYLKVLARHLGDGAVKKARSLAGQF